MIKAVKFVSIFVSDQDRALAFYTKRLGFSVVTDQPMGPDARWIELRIPGADTGVVIFKPMMPDQKVGVWQPFAFVSDDVRETYEQLSSRGVEFVNPPKAEKWGTSAMFKDPDGNTFVLSSK